MSVTKYINYCGLSVIGCCFKTRQGFIPGPVYDGDNTIVEVPVALDTTLMGNECVVVKLGKRICGTGAALANVEIAQDKCYFEIRIQSTGVWAVGLASTECDLNKIPLGKDNFSWVLKSSGELVHADTEIAKVVIDVSEGDYIGCSFDHVELNFYYNGKNLHSPITGIKGKVRPVVCVDEGCIADVNFDNFVFSPPHGFSKLMIEKDLL